MDRWSTQLGGLEVERWGLGKGGGDGPWRTGTWKGPLWYRRVTSRTSAASLSPTVSLCSHLSNAGTHTGLTRQRRSLGGGVAMVHTSAAAAL